jgi:Carboxypeptidase regulatory-like domain/Concanavalin A-like lectin/glucanases superfamily/FG-GAP-like repeat
MSAAAPHAARSRHPHPRVTRILVLLILATLAAVMAGVATPTPARAAVQSAQNAAGRLDTLGLSNLGNRTSVLYTFVAEDGAFTEKDFWKSGAGAFDASKTRFVAGDVNGDGYTDGIALYDLGHHTSRFYVFLSDGAQMTRRTAWIAKKGTYDWSRVKLTVGDVDSDGRDDVIALYDLGRGRSRADIFRSKGRTFAKSTGWTSSRGGMSWSKAQLAAGDVSGDGRDDAVVFYRNTTTASSLLVLKSTGTAFTKKTFWKGPWTTRKTALGVGDHDGDGVADAMVYLDHDDSTMGLAVWYSKKTSFKSPPEDEWRSDPGEVVWSAAGYRVGDVNGDGMADMVIQSPTGTDSSKLVIVAYNGLRWTSRTWWAGSLTRPRTRLACAPAKPFVLGDHTEVLSDQTMEGLTAESSDLGSMTFAPTTGQVAGLQVGDIITAAPSDELPYGALRKVTAVDTSGPDTVVTTTQATLEEAVQQGELSLHGSVTQNDIVKVLESVPGVRLVPVRPADPWRHAYPRKAGTSFGFTIEIDTTILDTVNLNGSLGFNQSFDVSAQSGVTSWWHGIPTGYGITSLSFSETTTQTTALRASVQGTVDKELKQEIAKYDFPTIVVSFGPVPVTFTPELTLYVGASGEVAAGVTTRVTQTTAVTAGIKWTPSTSWQPIQSFTSDRTFDPPQLFGSAELKAFAGAELMLKVYGVAGPTAALEAYTGLFADTLDTPWWKLSAGLDAKLGFKVDVWGLTLAETETSWNIFEVIIDQAGGGYAPQGAVAGTIEDSGSSLGLPGASVVLHQGAGSPSGPTVATTTAGSGGFYQFAGLPVGAYTVTATMPGYLGNSRDVSVAASSVSDGNDVSLVPLSAPGVTGRVVRTGTSIAIAGAAVELRQGLDAPSGPLVATTTSAADGSYLFTGISSGNYTMVASKADYFTNHISSVVGGSMLTGQEVPLLPYSSQGVNGHALTTLDGSGLTGCTVELRSGYEAPSGPLVASATSGVNGAFSFTGVAEGEYTLVATKTGYVRAIAAAPVDAGELTGGVELKLGPTDGSSPAKADTITDAIVWPDTSGSFVMDTNATYELWFRPSVLSAGYVAATTMQYSNFPGGVTSNAPILYIQVASDRSIAFGVNEYDGGGPMNGTWHTIWSNTFLQVGQWYHIAAETGAGGMKLFVDGTLEATGPYTGGPQADFSGGTLSGGWFGVGDNGIYGPYTLTALGAFRDLRVSSTRRYESDFTPDPDYTPDGATVIHDTLLGDTNGWNEGFVWTP